MKSVFLIALLFFLLGCTNYDENTNREPRYSSPGDDYKVAPEPEPNPGLNPNPNPRPIEEADPSTITAIRATVWSEVKYAFCSAQGSYGVLIDFQGSDMEKFESGQFTFGTRPCRGTKPFKWTKQLPFTASTKEGIVVFDFGYILSPENCYGCGNDTIEVKKELKPYTEGFGSMGGNSGPCVLLQNKATGGIFESGGFACK